MSYIKHVDLPRHAWNTPPFLLIASPTPPVQYVDAYVRSVNHVTTKRKEVDHIPWVWGSVPRALRALGSPGIKSPSDFKILSARKLKTLFQKYKLQLITTGIQACMGHVLRKYIHREFLKDTTTADGHENVAWKSEFIFFSVSIEIIPTRLLCQMQVNSSRAEFLSAISQFTKRMNFVIACLRPSQNVKSGIFTGSSAVDGKEMYKKAWCTCKVVVLPCQANTYLTFSWPPHLKLPIWSVKNRIFSGQIQLLLLIASQCFFHSSVVPSFLVRKVENKSFPCTHKLGERTGQMWRDNSRRVQTHEKNLGETVRRLGTIIQSILWA